MKLPAVEDIHPFLLHPTIYKAYTMKRFLPFTLSILSIIICCDCWWPC